MVWAVRRFSLETILEQVNAMDRIRVVPPETDRRMVVDGKVAPIQVITRSRGTADLGNTLPERIQQPSSTPVKCR
jgi:hypothetical protein